MKTEKILEKLPTNRKDYVVGDNNDALGSLLKSQVKKAKKNKKIIAVQNIEDLRKHE